MKLFTTTQLISLVFSSLITLTSLAQEPVKIEIPVLKDAQIFAQFDDKYPALINYFTTASEDTILSFYQQQYAKPINKERKRGRVTFFFEHSEQTIRVVISQQNKKRQVDVIIEKEQIEIDNFQYEK